MKGFDFLNDECKMVDFFALNKEQFLSSYGYLSSKDWDATYNALLGILKERGFVFTFEEELGDEACKWSAGGECTLCPDYKLCDGYGEDMMGCSYCDSYKGV